MKKLMTTTRSYSELRKFKTFEERYDYLKLKGAVGESTFGFERHLNQRFYTSAQWRHIRNHVIARDQGMDLGIDGYEIHDKPMVHHMNPMSARHIADALSDILDPEFLILTTHRTHNAIHYGDASQLVQPFVERQPGDTRLW